MHDCNYLINLQTGMNKKKAQEINAFTHAHPWAMGLMERREKQPNWDGFSFCTAESMQSLFGRQFRIVAILVVLDSARAHRFPFPAIVCIQRMHRVLHTRARRQTKSRIDHTRTSHFDLFSFLIIFLLLFIFANSWAWIRWAHVFNFNINFSISLQTLIFVARIFFFFIK